MTLSKIKLFASNANSKDEQWCYDTVLWLKNKFI